MLTEDYLMRMIRLATAAIARAFGLKAALLYRDSLAVLEDALGQVVGLPAEILHRMDDASIIALCANSSKVNYDQLYVVADLIRAEGEIFDTLPNPQESGWRFLRALNLFLEVFLHRTSDQLPASDEKIEALAVKFPLDTLPADLQYPLFYYYEKSGNYASAAQLLDILIRNNPQSGDLQAEARDFFQRMAKKPEEELIRGGLTAQFVQRRLKGHA
ncbi:MAG TPA: DUF6483 family protein [Anaerolineaceae bacterium]|nr:DUF6483 family protein [Anaerolineaceae bacterium]